MTALADRSLLLILAGSTLAVALALGWLSGEPPAPAAGAAANEGWALPQPAPPDVAGDVAELTRRHPWSATADARGGAAAGAPLVTGPQAAWRLAGIVERGDERFALLAFGASPAARIEYKRVGDSFPDGTTLIRVTADSATTEDTRSPAAPEQTYRLFGKK
jgi:hypothetical protein